jgi:hypothetical protein
MISYSEITHNFDEFRKIFDKASHGPFEDVELHQGKRAWRNIIRNGRLEKVPQTPDDFEAKVVLKRDKYTGENPYFDLVFKIRSDGSVFSDSRASYKNQPKLKWATLIQKWLKNSVSSYRTYERTEKIKEELVSTIYVKQMEQVHEQKQIEAY